MYRRPLIDMCLEFCEANGIAPKAHCLNYMTPGEFPKWWKKSDVKHEKELLEKRFRVLAERQFHVGNVASVQAEVICFEERNCRSG
jgi:hypothetical protein